MRVYDDDEVLGNRNKDCIQWTVICNKRVKDSSLLEIS